MAQNPDQLTNLIAGFTQEGTPLSAIAGSKNEWGVTILTPLIVTGKQ